jgi:serine protease
VIAQPPGLSDPNALAVGYCAFHDYTQPKIENGWYDGLTPGLVYTNMPYSLAINAGTPPNTFNVCGENAVNSTPRGKLDGFSIVLGHEIEEAITDPGAEEILGGDGLVTPQTRLGGWYDPFDANENGDKCAWVGIDPTDEQGTYPVPGAAGNMTGNAGDTFAVQSLWSNNSAGGAGWCAGAGTDLPGPLAGGEGGGIARSAAKHHRARRR